MLEPSEGEYAGKFFYANANGLQRIMLPGARVYDYSVALTKSEPADGVVEIGATLSEDTREFRYAIFTGNLSDGEASLKHRRWPMARSPRNSSRRSLLRGRFPFRIWKAAPASTRL